MSRHERSGPESPTHDTCQELLPWYDNGTLKGQELEQVEHHLSDCGACRSALASMRDLKSSLDRATDDDGAVAGSLDEIMTRIDAGGSAPRRTSTMVRVALLAQAAAILVLVSVLLFRGGPRLNGDPQSFHTLSDPRQAVVTASGSLRIVFEPSAQESQLRLLLQTVGAEIIAGPSPAGVYTIHVGGTRDLGAIVRQLRADVAVRLVEPIGTTD